MSTDQIYEGQKAKDIAGKLFRPDVLTKLRENDDKNFTNTWLRKKYGKSKRRQ